MTLRMISPIHLKPMSGSKPVSLLLFLAFILAVALSSCKKETNENISFHRGIESGVNYVFAQEMMTQLLATYFKTITDSTLLADGATEVDGAAVYSYPNETPRRIRIEYPDWSALDGYGHRRAGVIEVTTSGSFTDDGSEVDFRFVDFLYDFDSVTVDSMVMINRGKTDGKNKAYDVRVDRIDYQFIDSTGVFSFAIDQSCTVYKYGSSVYTNPKDSLRFYGALDGNTSRDLSFASVIAADSSLLFSYRCNFLKKGIVEIETEMFDYLTTVYFQEPDSCENTYLIVIDGNPFPQVIEELY